MNKYKSKYGADKEISAAQYLVEFMMERIAKREKATLPFKFWNLPRWNKQFRMQIKYANELLAEYSEEEVFAALRSKPGQRIFSLGAKKTMIVPLIEELRKNKAAEVKGQSEEAIELDWVPPQEFDPEQIAIYEHIEMIPEKELTINKNLWGKLK